MPNFVYDYEVEVSAAGEFVKRFLVENVPDANVAIGLVEAKYGEPPRVHENIVYNENGKKEIRLIVAGWHGYSFVARRVTALDGRDLAMA